jgi:hypothetical protein
MVLSSTLPLILDYLPLNLRWPWEDRSEMRQLAQQQQAHFLLFSDSEQIFALEEFLQAGFSKTSPKMEASFLCLIGQKGCYILHLQETGIEELQSALLQQLETLRNLFPFSPDPDFESMISALLARVQSLQNPSRLSRLVNHHIQAVQPEYGLFQPQQAQSNLTQEQNPLNPAFWQDEVQRMEVWVQQLQSTQYQDAYQSAKARWKEVRNILNECQQDSLRLRETERICLLFVQVGELVHQYFWHQEPNQNTRHIAENWISQVITQAITSAAAESPQDHRLQRLVQGLRTALNALKELDLSQSEDSLVSIIKALTQEQYSHPDLVAVILKALTLAVADRAAAAQEKHPLEKGGLQECLQASILLEISQFTQGDIDLLALHRAAVLLAEILYSRFFEPIPLVF